MPVYRGVVTLCVPVLFKAEVTVESSDVLAAGQQVQQMHAKGQIPFEQFDVLDDQGKLMPFVFVEVPSVEETPKVPDGP